MSEEKLIKKKGKSKGCLTIIAILIVLGIIGSMLGGGDEETSSADLGAQKPTKASVDDVLHFKGTMDLKADGEKVIMTVNTNVPDGGIFEVSIINGDFNVLSDFIEVKNGQVVKEFVIPEDWNVGYLSGMAMFRFNLDDHPQPGHIKEIYGEKGEKMKGDQTLETTIGGYNGNIEPVTIAYPDEATVKAAQSELLLNALNEMIKVSEGVILRIQPYLQDNDWTAVAVTVSDAWYFSPDHEKERFAEQIGATVETIIKSSGIVPKDKTIFVYFLDSYQKELATPKILGGYKILR